jgi:hypothetical protein
VAKEAGTDRGDDSSEDTRPEAIVGRRMTRGEPVGEGWLWGRLACELIAGRHVTREVMDRYRSGAFLARRAAYGEEAALEWEREAKDNHEIAKAVFRERNQPSQPRDVARHMPAMEFA